MEHITELNIKEQQILELLTNNYTSVGEISTKLYISEATARRKLASLEEKGLIIRTRGGAVLNQDKQICKNLPLYLRTATDSVSKNTIAGKAVKLIADGNTIFLDSSSTALYLIPFLHRLRNITVCTNSLTAATKLAEASIPCIFFGGNVIPGELSCNSDETREMIRRIYADIFFFSCDAVSRDGILSDNSKASSYLRLQYMKNSKNSVLLIDSTKINKQSSYLLCNLSDVDFCVSDSDIPTSITESAPDTVFI